MDIETLNIANAMVKTIKEIDDELQAWSETTAPVHLGRKQHWNNGHMVPLLCKHSPRAAFDAYRDACINALKVRRTETEAQLAAL